MFLALAVSMVLSWLLCLGMVFSAALWLLFCESSRKLYKKEWSRLQVEDLMAGSSLSRWLDMRLILGGKSNSRNFMRFKYS